MNINPKELYQKFIIISSQVRKNLRTRGVSIPVANRDGSVRLGKYTITKNSNGFYMITNERNDTVVDNINLPQTAAIIANSLSLGRSFNKEMLEKDRDYGYALFEELLQKRAIQKSATKDPDYADLMLSKCLVSKDKKDSCKRYIVHSFEKLRKLA